MAGLGQGCVLVTTQPQAPLPELLDGRDLLYVPPADTPHGARPCCTWPTTQRWRSNWLTTHTSPPASFAGGDRPTACGPL